MYICWVTCIYAGCRCALCVFPAVADIVSVAFTTVYLFALWTTTKRMMAAAINRRIQRRLRTFQFVTIAGGPSPVCSFMIHQNIILTAACLIKT